MATKRKITKPRKTHAKTKSIIARLQERMTSQVQASIGNEWYRLRSKHGRDKLFSTPELLWEAAVEYFKSVDDNPLYESKPMVVSLGGNMGSGVQMQNIPRKRPYTFNGLCMYLNINRQYFIDFKRGKSYTEDFSLIIERIEATIHDQKFDGAAAGLFNANIIAYDLGLVKKVDVTSDGEAIKQPEFKIYNNAPPLADSEEKVSKKRGA